MDIKKGKNRIVFVFPKKKIVVKIAIIHIFWAIRYLFAHTFHNHHYWKNFKDYSSRPIESPAITGLKGHLLEALYNNWNEFFFFFQTRNPLLQPTYFSFFGLLNIQKYGEPYALPEKELLWQLLFLTDKQANNDLHHFGERHNFCLQNGKLRMVDYGSSKTRNLITKYGKRIFESFDPTYKFDPHGRIS